MNREHILGALLATAALTVTQTASANHHEGKSHDHGNSHSYSCTSKCAGEAHGNGCHGHKIDVADEATCKKQGGDWKADENKDKKPTKAKEKKS